MQKQEGRFWIRFNTCVFCVITPLVFFTTVPYVQFEKDRNIDTEYDTTYSPRVGMASFLLTMVVFSLCSFCCKMCSDPMCARVVQGKAVGQDSQV